MADKKLRVGILGTGKMAGTMASAIGQMSMIELHAVASRDMEDACTFALKYDIGKAYGRYEEMMKDTEIDLIYLAVPHSHHAYYASMCIDHKKPVLVEKPLAVNADQAEALIAKAEHEGVFLAEAVQTRYMPMVGTIRESVRSGKIGTVNAISANLGYALSREQRILAPELAGGALLETGVYPLAFLSMIAGNHVTDITCEARKSRSGVDTENHVIMVMKDGEEQIRCSIYSSVIGPTDRQGIIYGTDGYIVVHNIHNFEYLEIYNKENILLERVERPEQKETEYVYEMEACRKAILEGRLECEELPHSEITVMMKMMDLIRQGMEVRYPFE